jgi:hypothetical protein
MKGAVGLISFRLTLITSCCYFNLGYGVGLLAQNIYVQKTTKALEQTCTWAQIRTVDLMTMKVCQPPHHGV